MVATAQGPHGLSIPCSGWAEHDALSSYLARRLTDASVLDHDSASQCHPYDVARGGRAGDWAADVAGHTEVPELRWPAQVWDVDVGRCLALYPATCDQAHRLAALQRRDESGSAPD